MDSIIKGFFLGIFYLVAFILILSSMTSGIILSESGSYCGYGCSVRTLFSLATHPLFLMLVALFWILGSKSARLAELIREKREKDEKMFGLSKKYPKEFKMPWEHKLSKVEDKD